MSSYCISQMKKVRLGEHNELTITQLDRNTQDWSPGLFDSKGFFCFVLFCFFSTWCCLFHLCLSSCGIIFVFCEASNSFLKIVLSWTSGFWSNSFYCRVVNTHTLFRIKIISTCYMFFNLLKALNTLSRSRFWQLPDIHLDA